MKVHVVMWKFASGIDTDAAFVELKEALEGLVGVVDGLISLELGLNDNPSDAAWDLCLISRHDSQDALTHYQSHPAHVSAGALVKRYTSQRVVVDYQR